MRLLAKAFVLLLAVGPFGCASLGENGTGGAGGTGAPVVSVACNSSAGPSTAFLDWELTVSPDEPIVSGQPFMATLGGIAVFPEDFLDTGHENPLLEGGIQRGDLVELNATVQVRSGAMGDVMVTLTPAADEYTCSIDGSPCDPANDLPSVPGLRENADCEGQSRLNPCGRFMFVPTSTDCQPDGECDRLGKMHQCDLHDACITGDLEIRLQQESARYTAAAEGDVLFGWAEEGTGAELDQTGGPNDGTWILPILYDEDDPFGGEAYEKPAGPIGIRATFAGFPVALECTMGAPCVIGVECAESLPKPTPDSELISFPIEAEAP
jgi:hypothetical protein